MTEAPRDASTSSDDHAIAYLTRLSRCFAEADSSEDMAATALQLACELVPPARWASLTSREGRPRTIAASDHRADELDELQYHASEGPCLAAIATGTTVVSDFGTEQRWPTFAARAVTDTSGRAALSYPLAAVGHPATSLNLYADVPGAFDEAAIAAASLSAAGIGMALAALRQKQRADNLALGLESSRHIGAAIGILMHRHRWTSERAFEALRLVSQHTHRKVRDVADEVMLTGSLPSS
jgi:hypothetical protein